MVSPERLQNLEPNMPGTKPDVLRLADAEVDVADIDTLNSQNPEVIGPAQNPATARQARLGRIGAARPRMTKRLAELEALPL